jgi:hypothetical protein
VEVTDGVKSEFFRLWLTRNQTLPHEARDVLPTRFGNAIRAFETYPYKVYGVDSIPAWLRLQGVVPKDFVSTINDARAQVDFFLNVLTLALLIGAAAAARLIYNAYMVEYCTHNDLSAIAYCVRHDWNHVFRWEFCIWIGLAIMLARGCYELAIDRAIAWGDLVRSAFDLYLPMLAGQLGYILPDNNEDRKLFWDAVNSLFLYNIPIPDSWPRISAEAAANQSRVDRSLDGLLELD